MKSLQQYISEQIVLELSSDKLTQAYNKEVEYHNGHETNRARKFKRGAKEASDREREEKRQYNIGDLYSKGDKVIGIVVGIKDNRTIVMSLTSFDKYGEFCKVEDEMSWYVATNSVKKLGKGWHLPSREEFKTMYNSFEKIQSVLKETKGATKLDNENDYWTSEQHGENDAYLGDIRDGDVDSYINKAYVHYVRAFLTI